MTTTLLAAFPSPPQGVWHLGWFPIRAYALFIIAGIIVALVIGDRRWVARGGEAGVVYDIALWAVPFGLIGGRLYHVITDWQAYFGTDGRGFIAALKIWDGGLGIWGAVALGGVGAWIGCRQRGIPLPAFGDAIAPGIILAQAIGRLGNYFNQELYGRPTSMPWGMKVYERRDATGVLDVHSVDGISTGQVHAIVQPTFLYELIWNVLVFVLLIYIDRRLKLGHGRLFATYVAAYCVGRFWIELLRDDTATHIAGIRINSFTSTFVFIGAIVYIMLAPRGREDPAALVGKPREREEKPKVKAKKPVKALKEPVKAEDSALVEWTHELAAVAAPSGVVAGVAVAAEDEDEEEAASADAEPEAKGETKSDEESEESEESVESADEAPAEALTADVEAEKPEPEPLEEEATAPDEEAGEDSVEPPQEAESSEEAAEETGEREGEEPSQDEASAEQATEESVGPSEEEAEGPDEEAGETEEPGEAEAEPSEEAQPEAETSAEEDTEESVGPSQEVEPSEVETEETGEVEQPAEVETEPAEPVAEAPEEKESVEASVNEAQSGAMEATPIEQVSETASNRRRWRLPRLGGRSR
jgi:prolipoprotein diacylglyceryl transferase